jgi:uncharacterized Rmd1/YagE family protein
MQNVKIVAYRLGDTINLKKFKEAYTGNIYSSSLTEIFIRTGDNAYVYVQNYGEVAFSDCDDKTIREFIAMLAPYIDKPIAPGKEYKEDFTVATNPGQPINFEFNSIQVPEVSADVIKIVMLNVSQSVVLDYFTELSQNILYETTKYTNELEASGKVGISKIKLMKLIGKTLNIRNRITDNLYFLDAPDTVWEVEYLSEINAGLSRTFNLKTRFKEVEYTLTIIDNNQTTFAQLVQHRDANKLEWIIILLILFEVVNTVFGKYIFR